MNDNWGSIELNGRCVKGKNGFAVQVQFDGFVSVDAAKKFSETLLAHLNAMEVNFAEKVTINDN